MQELSASPKEKNSKSESQRYSSDAQVSNLVEKKGGAHKHKYPPFIRKQHIVLHQMLS